jgi:hypothetical protein
MKSTFYIHFIDFGKKTIFYKFKLKETRNLSIYLSTALVDLGRF